MPAVRIADGAEKEEMFARTSRLLLRPGFPEDASALAAAIGDHAVASNLSRVPWPYRLSDANAFLRAPHDPQLPSLLIVERTTGAPRLVGGCGLSRSGSGSAELGYWIAPSDWGRGFATEACRALVEIAAMLGIGQLEASYFIDNPASGRVLEKLGFTSSGLEPLRPCLARRELLRTRLMHLTLAAGPQRQASALAA